MARIATVVLIPPPFRRRTTKKEEPRRSPRSAVTLDERIEEIMDRVQQTGDNQVERVAALPEYLTPGALTEARRGSIPGADSYLALGRVDDAVRAVSDATRSGYAEGAEMLCELAEKLIRSGHEPRPGSCDSRLASATPTTSGSMRRLASSMAISATTPELWSGFWLNIPQSSTECPHCGTPQTPVAVAFLRALGTAPARAG
jgi:hypothetical protein